jgi:hypothetical protein
MYIIAVFTIPKLYNQSRCPSTNEWINQMQYAHRLLVYKGVWFQGDPIEENAQDVMSKLYCRCLIHFPHNATQLMLKICHMSINLTFSSYYLG